MQQWFVVEVGDFYSVPACHILWGNFLKTPVTEFICSPTGGNVISKKLLLAVDAQL